MSDETFEGPLVVVGVDGSEDGLRAVRFGSGWAQRFGARLLIVHAVDDAMLAGAWGVVYDPDILQSAGNAATEQAAKAAIDHGLPADRVRTSVVLGSPSGVLTRLSEQADLIVVGRRSVSGLERMFVGSTSVSVVANSACPVMVISAAAHPQPVGERGVIGVGITAGASNHAVLDAGFDLAERYGAALEIVHAVQPPVGLLSRKLSPADLEAQVKFAGGGVEAVAKSIAEKRPGVSYTCNVVADSPINELVSGSANWDVLVVGIGDGAIPGFGVGGLLRGLMAHSACPLYLVHKAE